MGIGGIVIIAYLSFIIGFIFAIAIVWKIVSFFLPKKQPENFKQSDMD